MSKLDELSQAVEAGKAKLVPALVQAALDEGNSATDVLNVGMIDAMDRVGEKFKNGDIFVPEMMIAARAMKTGVEILKPYLASSGCFGRSACRRKSRIEREGRSWNGKG